MVARNFSVKDKIINRIQQLLPGTILFIQDFLGDGSSEAVRQQLTRLVKSGDLQRLSQGVYLIPKKLDQHGQLLPTADELAAALARRDKTRIIATGEVALWKLGLTTQVPLNHVYLTDGPSRVIKIENAEGETSYSIMFKHASPKNFALQGKISSQVVQALKTIGERNLSEKLLDKITALIVREDMADLNHDLTVAPAWISKLIRDSFKSYT
ncbi:MAG: DUF6088 family protein [Flammeovirgaceae bacterium]|jgi:hypothetical protein|nr:DUF6088 family protein [Flammeovirgaceae bacterium]